MNNDCPLPVDWLDFLDGNRAVASSEHLKECPSCRQVVETLASETKWKDLRLGDWLKGIELSKGSAWKEAVLDTTTFGQIWLSASGFEWKGFAYRDLDRLPMLVLGTTGTGKSASWLDVVPMWIDIENATPTDLVLNADETTLGSQLRVLFHLQTTVAREQLDSCVGTLSESGEVLIRDVLADRFDPLRFGYPFEGQTDPRLESSRWIEEIMHVIGSFHQWHTEADGGEANAEQAVRPVIPFQLMRSARREEPSLALAAKSDAVGSEIEALAKSEELLVEGRLLYKLFSDYLLLAIQRVEGVHGPIRVIVHSKRLLEPCISSPFMPQAGSEVVIAKGQAVLPQEIESMELLVGRG